MSNRRTWNPQDHRSQFQDVDGNNQSVFTDATPGNPNQELYDQLAAMADEGDYSDEDYIHMDAEGHESVSGVSDTADNENRSNEDETFAVEDETPAGGQDVEEDNADVEEEEDEMDELLRSHFNDIFPGTSGPKTSYSERRSFWLRAFDLARFLLVTAFACFLSSDLNGRVCQLQGCANKARFKCHTCFAVSSELPCFFCEHDAILHEWNCLCHRVRNENNAPPPPRTTAGGHVRRREIRCCEQARSGKLVHFHSLTSSQIVRVLWCTEHQDGTHLCSRLIKDFGFFPARIKDLNHAFSIQMMELGLKMRCKSVSYQSIAEIFLGTEHKDVRRLRLYEPFMDALRQFAIVHNFYHHGIVSEAIQARHGPIAVTMDGFESASKKSVAAGGGGNHGFYAMAKAWFFTPTVPDVVREGKSQAAPRLGCEAQHKAGSERVPTSNGKDIDRIIHVDCAAHSIVLHIYDAKGERLLYADDVLSWLASSFGHRAIIFGYDVACKFLSHLLHYGIYKVVAGLLILFIPAMHVYAHGKDCQCLFGPRILFGLGLTMDGEGHERFNSWLARSIGLTLWETTENRQLDIVLVSEDYNRVKIRGLVEWTLGKLLQTFASLKSIRDALSNSIDRLRNSKYSDVVASITRQRQSLAKRVSVDVPSNKDTLRETINHYARTILSVRKYMKKNPGTKLAARLKTALSANFTAMYAKISEFNNLEPKHDPPLNFAQVEKDLVVESSMLTSENTETLVTLYWRYCEDLYHHRNHLRNLRDYYLDKKANFWEGALKAEALAMEDERVRDACIQLLERRMSVEAVYCEDAAAALELFDSGENSVLFLEEHLNQINHEFCSEQSVLADQNVRDGIATGK
ncbi:hypothetical protein HDU79_004371 [Rhizoclosmatium sp. JEL0117]|nr:hypothetical protein HDU79_004371 [Rhizoclosmatium sp. JEL0117]